jgi:hypothetical protein
MAGSVLPSVRRITFPFAVLRKMLLLAEGSIHDQALLRRLIIICLAILIPGTAITIAFAPQAEPIKTSIKTYVDPALDYTQKLGGAIGVGTFVANQIRKRWKPHPI